MLCHRSGVKSLAINQTGHYMVTSGQDHILNVWDLRTYKQLRSLKLEGGASSLAFSQKNLIAAAMRNQVHIFKHDLLESKPDNEIDGEQVVELFDDREYYLKHRLANTSISSLQFCPYEDVLGIGHGTGITSILVPGSGEANFDAFEANPYESKGQRRQWEVKALLEKIQPELISLDPVKLKTIDKKTLQEKMEERNKKLVRFH